jgi:hypothetical protein
MGFMHPSSTFCCAGTIYPGGERFRHWTDNPHKFQAGRVLCLAVRRKYIPPSLLSWIINQLRILMSLVFQQTRLFTNTEVLGWLSLILHECPKFNIYWGYKCFPHTYQTFRKLFSVLRPPFFYSVRPPQFLPQPMRSRVGPVHVSGSLHWVGHLCMWVGYLCDWVTSVSGSLRRMGHLRATGPKGPNATSPPQEI